MPKGSKKDRFARMRELAAFDEQILLRILRTPRPRIPTSPYPHGMHSPCIAGFDEAGRGAIAGPVVVGCVHFPFFSTVASSPDASVASELVSDVALFGLCDNVADELPRYETKARSSVVSESHPHIGQAVSDLLLTQQPALSHDPAVASELVSDVPLAKGNSASPDHSITQSFNPPMTQFSDDSILRLLAGIDDSKRLTAKQREALLPRIKTHAMWGVGAASAKEIDTIGIVPAVSLAARRAYRAMGMEVDLLLCDRGINTGLARFLASDRARKGACPVLSQLPDGSILQSSELSFTRGDSRSLHIAAASILAKVTRDRMMADLDSDFPGYDFSIHKGYGTAAHLAALRKLGPSAIHRRSFRVK